MWRGTIAAASVLILTNLCLADIDPQQQKELDAIRNGVLGPKLNALLLKQYPCPKLDLKILYNDRTWMVAIIKIYPQNEYWCDGAIVHPRAVIGSHNRIKSLNPKGTIVTNGKQKIGVKEIRYSKSRYPGAAIIVLSEQFLLGTENKLISLPNFDYIRSQCDCFIISLVSPYTMPTMTLVRYDNTCAESGLVCTTNLNYNYCKNGGFLVCPVGKKGSEYILASVQSESAIVDTEQMLCDLTYSGIPSQRKWINEQLRNISNVKDQQSIKKPYRTTSKYDITSGPIWN